MKRLLFSLLVVCALTSAAQDTEKTVTLDEVTVKGARTIQKVDGQWIYPTKQQIESSTNGYSLLAKLTLPHIRVDEAQNSITALTNLGTVQVRINDIIASREDLQTLDMQGIDHIEFIDNPGVRYGEDIAYIINIRVKKPVSGYVLGTQLTNALTTVNGNESLFGKINHGRSEFALSYDLDYHNFKGAEYDEQASYELESGDITSIHRYSLNKQSKNISHNAQLTYSLSDSNYVFQTKLSGSNDIQPQQRKANMMINDNPYDELSSSRSSSPSLDLYYHQDFRRHQSLTANIVGTYINTAGDTENNEGAEYRYEIDGRTYSLWSEALYENQLKTFTISAGAQYGQRYSHNRYQEDVDATNDMHTSSLYLFSQLKGHLGQLSLIGGLGASRRYYRQGDATQDYWFFRPKFTVSYPLTNRLKVKYDFEITQHTSQIALVSNVSIKQNAVETILGNPNIHPNRVVSHQLKLSYSTPRFTSELQGYYRLNPHCSMEKYIRQDDHFYQTQTNADNECNFFYIDTYNQWDIILKKLTATVYGGIYRFFNFGEDYTHTYTSFNGGCSLQAFLGRWTLGAYADNGWNFMEGEHRGHQAQAWHFTCNYRMNDAFSISLYAQHPFSQHPLTNKTEVVSRYVQKEISQHYRDYGNMLTLKLTCRLDHGRKYRDIQRSMNHSDKETGILSK
ncbi:MAG: TonB-dependent receptor [Prevotella sp.]|nr:TonB-dependent receptor [Prevotella sp.]